MTLKPCPECGCEACGGIWVVACVKGCVEIRCEKPNAVEYWNALPRKEENDKAILQCDGCGVKIYHDSILNDCMCANDNCTGHYRKV